MPSQFTCDSAAFVTRRGALGMIGLGAGGLALAACDKPAFGQAGKIAADGSCLATNTEIRGPFPADGTNGGGKTINVLGKEGLIRQDIRSSFSGMNGQARGVRLDLELHLVSANARCTPLAGRAVYVWMCDARGEYSLYTLPGQNYLRGMQATGVDGVARFIAILPGCYGGRCPHLHFEVFEDIEDAANGARGLLVSQLAFPTNECRQVYEQQAIYGESLRNLARNPLESDWMFAGDNAQTIASQTIRLSGDPAHGFQGRATISI